MTLGVPLGLNMTGMVLVRSGSFTLVRINSVSKAIDLRLSFREIERLYWLEECDSRDWLTFKSAEEFDMVKSSSERSFNT